MADWNAAQYLKYEDERTRPSRDLIARVPLEDVRRAYDLGCGPGNSTEVVRQRYPQADLTGLDSSPDMLRKARERLPDVTFVEGDLRTWSPPPDTDLLFSNAVFQWVPDHLAVLERLLKALPASGVLAVQMPDNFNEPSHRLMREVAAGRSWTVSLADAARDERPPVSAYYDKLKPHCRHLDIWHTHYQHPLDGAPAIVEWLKGTALRAFLDPLAPVEQAEFVAEYTARIARAYPAQYDGKVLLRFPRLFLIAVR